MNKQKKKRIKLKKRQLRVRSKIEGSSKKPRLSVFRSNIHIYAQLIDDMSNVTLGTTSDADIKKGSNIEKATQVGNQIAEVAKKLKITEVIFDRGGYRYHGRIKALADGAREGGLKF